MEKDAKRFLLHSILFLSFYMIYLLLCISQTDYETRLNFHVHDLGKLDGYPPMAAWVVNVFNLIIPRYPAVIIAEILTMIVLPYILLHALTKDIKICFLYLIGSGLVITLMDGAFLAQSIIHLFMLACLIWRPFYFIFLLAGFLTHREWGYGFLLVGAYDFSKSGGVGFLRDKIDELKTRWA